jgi:hypothetical protein
MVATIETNKLIDPNLDVLLVEMAWAFSNVLTNALAEGMKWTPLFGPRV